MTALHFLRDSIWLAGVFGHSLVLVALLRTRRIRRFPFFSSLMVFDILRALALALVVVRLSPTAIRMAALLFEICDLTLEFGVLAELVLTALWPLGRLRRVTLPLLLLASGGVLVMRLAPISRYPSQAAPLLLHFALGVLFVEWSLALALMRRQLRLRWRSDVAAISLGFGVYSATLLLAGGYFRVGRDLSDFILFSYLRITAYLAVVLWWILALWNAGDGSHRPREA